MPQHGDQFEEAAELSLECLGWISHVNTSIIHSGKVLSNKNRAHHAGLIALTHALRWGKPSGPTGPLELSDRWA